MLMSGGIVVSPCRQWLVGHVLVGNNEGLPFKGLLQHTLPV